MAILGGYPVLDSPSQLPSLGDADFADSRTLAFRSLDGTSILPFTGDEFIAQWGIQGLDMPPREIVEEEFPGEDGSDLVDIKILPRQFTIPIFCGSNSGHLPYLRNRERMRSFFDHRRVDYRREGGTFDLVASSASGERSLRAVYVEGMDGTWDQATTGSYFESFGLIGRSVRTYWYGERWATPKVTRPAGFSWFGRFPPVLSSSRTLGADIHVQVGGQAPSWPRIDMMGPAPSVEVVGPGLYVLIPDGLEAGEVAVIDTDPRYRATRGALFNGLLDWQRIAPQRQFAPMVAGDNVFNLNLGAAGVDAYAYVSGWSRYDTPW